MKLAFVLGFVIALLTQAAVRWWLDSRTGVMTMAISLLVGAAVAAPTLEKALALWLGVMSGSVVVLFSIGPGNIWPIVLVFAAAITSASVLAGVGAGRATRRLRFR